MAKVKKIKVNMKGVETGAVLIPEGDYEAKVDAIEVAESEKTGGQYLKWTFKITSPESKGQKIWHITSLQPQALFNLKGVLLSLGVVVPESEFELDFDDLEGRSCGLTVAHEMYDGKNRARVTEFYPLDALESGDDDGEVDLESMDLDELLDFASENDITLPAKIKKSKSKVIAAIEAALGEDEEEAEEEVKAPKGKKGKKEAEPEEDDEDDEDSDETIDLDELDLKGLKALAAENDIDIPKKIAKDEKKVRAFLEEQLGEDEDAEEESADDEEEVDLDAMDLKELIAFAKENDITLSKKAKANEKLARKAIMAAMEDEE